VLIAIAAAWMIARDHRAALDNAELHLDNFAIVLAEHTRLALRTAGPEIIQAMSAGEPATAVLAPGGAFPQFFTNLYGGLELAYQGRVLLLREDGTLLAAVPEQSQATGRNFREHRLFTEALKRSSAGAIEAPGIVDSGERLIAYRKVTERPVLVAVSTPMNEVLAGWRRDASVIGFGALLLIALSLVAGFMLARQLRVTGELTDAAAANEMRLNSIISSAMDAIITVDEDEKIILFNSAAEKIFRCPQADAVGSALDRFIPPRYRSQHHEHIKRFGAAGVTMRRMGGALVLSGLRATGEEFPIDASISHTSVAGRKFFTVILRDVTERQLALEEQRAAQRRLEESELRLQSIIGAAMDAIITIDEQHNIVLFNIAAEKTFGCKAADAIGTNIERFIPERFRAHHREHVARFGRAGVTMRRMGGELVLAGLRSDGDEFPIDASISHVTVGEDKFYTVILRDITERLRAADTLKKSHQELRELYEAMHQVREAERTRIARELHDELAQWLTALKMDASWIATRLPREHEQLVAKAERMKSVVDSTVTAMRRIAADLRPVMLDDLGLVPALESLLNDLSERAGIEATLNAAGDQLQLQEPLATAVYRMVQEALTNVARHANASAVVVDVGVVQENLFVRVRDNGQGLKPDPNRKSFGLLGIRERARTLGGEARIYSQRQGGTVVEIDIPLQTSAPAGVST
jgi:PAS domain S-box-containing protein